jgi:hypothetical protein
MAEELSSRIPVEELAGRIMLIGISWTVASAGIMLMYSIIIVAVELDYPTIAHEILISVFLVSLLLKVTYKKIKDIDANAIELAVDPDRLFPREKTRKAIILSGIVFLFSLASLIFFDSTAQMQTPIISLIGGSLVREITPVLLVKFGYMGSGLMFVGSAWSLSVYLNRRVSPRFAGLKKAINNLW